MIDEKFSGITKLGDNLLINHLEANFKSFLDWGFLHIGGFVNVNIPDNNIHNNALYTFKPAENANYDTGQLWQTVRKDWVWESGVIFDSHSPINISGIFINSSFYPIGTSDPTYKYTLNFQNSELVFDNPIPVDTNIHMNYSYRWVQVYNYIDAKWWQELQFNTDNTESFFEQNSGDFSKLPSQRVQLPAIVIETVPRGSSEPYRLGDKSLIVYQDMLLHILAENISDRNTIIDIIRLQQDKVIWLYNIDDVIASGVYAINFDGTLNSSRLQYDNLVKNSLFQWKRCKINNIFVSEVDITPSRISEGTIRLTCEIIFSEM